MFSSGNALKIGTFKKNRAKHNINRGKTSQLHLWNQLTKELTPLYTKELWCNSTVFKHICRDRSGI